MATDPARPQSRPKSPHLTVWRWGPGMLISILHRMTGAALAIAGLALLVWWLMAIAASADAYADFNQAATHPLGLVVLVGLTWAFFQHLLSGVRHLVMDTGAALELDTNKRFALLTLVGSLVLTLLIWVPVLGGLL
ncbi:MAG: succinate dehydrogenase, cytochrome b556 subunit [Sphingomicrobium sp.]